MLESVPYAMDRLTTPPGPNSLRNIIAGYAGSLVSSGNNITGYVGSLVSTVTFHQNIGIARA